MKHAELLSQVEIFKGLPETRKGLLAEQVREHRFEDLEIVFRAGDASDCLYVVASGAVALWADTVGEPIDLRARIEPAGVFGEVGVLEGSPRSLTARASGPTTLLLLDGADLIRLAKAEEPLARELCRVAIGYSLENQAARAQLARRKEARIRVDQPVELRLAGRKPMPVFLENLSLGGACLRGVPEDWRLGVHELLSVGIDPMVALFSVHGRIAWRSADRVGISFTQTPEDHESRIARVLERLIRQAKLDS